MATNEVDEYIKNSWFSIFRPAGPSDLRHRYPSLKNTKEFSDLNAKELLFVWYYRCKASDGRRLRSDQQRLEYALKMAYEGDVPDDIWRRYSSGNIPEKVKQACVKMEEFEPGLRTIVHRQIQKTLDNFYKASQIDLANDILFTDKDGVVDWTKKRAAAEMLSMMAKAAPELLRKIEDNAMGVEDKKGDAESINYLADYHDMDQGQ